MSTSKLDTSSAFQPVTVHVQHTRLNVPASGVRIRKNGIEFRISAPIPTWTEMSVDLESPGNGKRLRCRGVVVALSLIHISEPTRLLSISYAVFCLKKK